MRADKRFAILSSSNGENMPAKLSKFRKATVRRIVSGGGGSGANFHPNLFFLCPMGDGVNEPTVLFWPHSGGTNHLVKSGVTFSSGGPDGGIFATFTTTSYMTLPYTTSGSINAATLKPFTVLFRVKPTGAGQLFCIRGTAYGKFALTGTGPFDITVTPVTTIRMQTSGAPVLANQWNSVAIVRNASNSWACYVNGSAVTLATNSTTDDMLFQYYTSSTVNYRSPIFGASSGGFAGSLDDVRIYAAELTLSNINAEFEKVYR
jgi:hypothetical protein